MGSRPGRRWTLRLWSGLALALTLASVLLTVLAMDGARMALLREATTSAAVVGRAMVRQFDTPIRFGVPLASVVAVPEFLDEVRRSTSGIAYIAVTDPKGQVLYASGAKIGTVLPVPSSPAELGPESELAPEITPLDPYLNVRWPLGDPGRALGFIHVGTDERLALPFLGRVGDAILVAWAVALLAAFQVTAFLIMRCLHRPLTSLRRLLAAVRAGNFARAGAIGDGAPAGSLSGTLRAWVREVNARYQALAQRIEEARAAHFDPTIIAEIDRLRQTVPGRFAAERAVSGGGERRFEPRTGFAWFFLVAAIEVCRPFLAVQAQLLAQDWPGLSPSLAGALPAIVLLAMGAFGIIVSGGVTPAGRGREVMLGGFVLAAAALMLAGSVPGYARLIACLAIAGAGLGLALGAPGLRPALGLVESRRAATMLALPVALALVAGPALGGYVVDRLGGGGVFSIAALLLVVAAMLGLAEATPGSGEGLDAAAGETDSGPSGEGAEGTALERLLVLLALAIIGGILFCLLPSVWAGLTAPVSPPLIGLTAALLGFSVLALRPFSGFLARRFRPLARLGLAGFVAGIGLVAGLGWGNPVAWAAAASAGLGVALGLAIGAAERHGLRTLPRLPLLMDAGLKPVLAGALALGALAVGAAAMAAMIELWGIAGAARATGMLAILAAAGIILLRMGGHRPSEAL